MIPINHDIYAEKKDEEEVEHITDEQWEFEEKERLKIIKGIDAITGQNDAGSRMRFFMQQICSLYPAQIPNMSHSDTHRQNQKLSQKTKHKKSKKKIINFDEQSLRLLEEHWFEYPKILKHDSCLHLDSKGINQLNQIDSKLITKLFLINNEYVAVPSIDEYQLINPKHFDITEFWESDYHRNWSDIHSDIKSFCTNCWLSLLPHLHDILKKIVQHSQKYSRQCLKLSDKSRLTQIALIFLNDETTLYHFHFISQLLNFLIILKLVFRKKRLYKHLFRYYWILCKMVLCSDVICGKYDHFAILNEIKMKLLDQFFLKTFAFWNGSRHEKYLRALGGLVMHFVIKNMVKTDHQQMLGPSTISQLLFCLKSKCNIHKNDILWNSSMITKFIRDFCWVQYNGWIKSKAPQLIHCIGHDNIKHVINALCPYNHPFTKWSNLELLGLIDGKKMNELNASYNFRYTEKYRCNKKCCSPKCNKRQYRRNLNILKPIQNKTKINLQWDMLDDCKKEFIKYKFYKCKGCKVAVYCSKKCQKVHWNRYKHKLQCQKLISAYL